MSARHPHVGRRRRAALVALGVLALVVVGCSGDGGDGGDAGSEPGGTGQGGELSVLAYNVAGLPAEVSGEDPEAHIPLISPRLDDFDVVLTQEDFDWWGEAAGALDFVHYHERLRADVTHEHRSPAHPGPEAVDLPADRLPMLQVGDGLGVLSRFPIEGDTRVPWVGCFGGIDTADGGAGDCLAMKGFQVTRLQLADGMEVDLYNLHAEAGGTEADQALQADGYEQLAAFMAEHSEGRAVILGGDTNLHTDDVHPDGSDGADTEIWARFLDATGLTDACDATGCPEPGRIDKAAVRSGGGVELEVVSHRFLGDRFVDGDGEPLSDHEPLEVRIRWRPT